MFQRVASNRVSSFKLTKRFRSHRGLVFAHTMLQYCQYWNIFLEVFSDEKDFPLLKIAGPALCPIFTCWNSDQQTNILKRNRHTLLPWEEIYYGGKRWSFAWNGWLIISIKAIIIIIIIIIIITIIIIIITNVSLRTKIERRRNGCFRRLHDPPPPPPLVFSTLFLSNVANCTSP